MALNVTGAAEYQAVLDKINLWYGSDAQQIINIINQYELTPQQVAQDYLSGSGFEPWYTTSGAVGGYNSVGNATLNSATAAQSAANSNIGAETSTITRLKTPIETTVNAGGKVEATNGLTSVATGAKSALTFISKEVLPAVSAAGLGIALGKTIDAALYNANPDFWDNAGMPSLNPETWNSITQDYPDGFLKKAFNTIFGLNPNTGETQQYLDAEAAAYLAMYMQQAGVFADGTEHYDYDDTTTVSGYKLAMSPVFGNLSFTGQDRYSSGAPVELMYATSSNSSTICALFKDTNNSRVQALFVDRVPFTITSHVRHGDPSTYTASQFSYDSISGYQYVINAYPDNYSDPTNLLAINAYRGNLNTESVVSYCTPQPSASSARSIFNSLLLTGTTKTEDPAVDGISNQSGATLPNFTGCTTPSDYKTALENQYPDLFNNAVTQSVVNEDGTTSTRTYLPIGTPSHNNAGNEKQPITTGENSGNSQSNQSANPNTVDLTGLQNLINTLTQTISQTGTPTNPTNPDPTGTGNTPPIVTPTGQASALWSVYNPSQAALNSFGAWLWSNNFIDQVLKLFNNPMQSIIGVHKIFASPAISGSANIKVGYLDSGVAANTVGAQYTSVNCGSVRVTEQFGNVFDYDETTIRLYLPFIGIVQLDTSDVMRGTVSVVYHVDVITGACLAEVKITRDGGGGTLYQFSGDAAVRYPISSGSYMGVVSGVLGVVGGIASGIMSGGATLPMAAGAIAGGIGNAKTQVQHSGSFAGNAGAMGGKKPYLIIERPQSYIADDFEPYQGKGANKVRTVDDMTGYFKMTDVRTDSITGAADSEIEAIQAALERGVIK